MEASADVLKMPVNLVPVSPCQPFAYTLEFLGDGQIRNFNIWIFIWGAVYFAYKMEGVAKLSVALPSMHDPGTGD